MITAKQGLLGLIFTGIAAICANNAHARSNLECKINPDESVSNQLSECKEYAFIRITPAGDARAMQEIVSSVGVSFDRVSQEQAIAVADSLLTSKPRHMNYNNPLDVREGGISYEGLTPNALRRYPRLLAKKLLEIAGEDQIITREELIKAASKLPVEYGADSAAQFIGKKGINLVGDITPKEVFNVAFHLVYADHGHAWKDSEGEVIWHPVGIYDIQDEYENTIAGLDFNNDGKITRAELEAGKALIPFEIPYDNMFPRGYEGDGVKPFEVYNLARDIVYNRLRQEFKGMDNVEILKKAQSITRDYILGEVFKEVKKLDANKDGIFIRAELNR
ncbi:hypothetical protein ACFL6I_11225 [candidate division KSB1 bacterium]